MLIDKEYEIQLSYASLLVSGHSGASLWQAVCNKNTLIFRSPPSL